MFNVSAEFLSAITAQTRTIKAYYVLDDTEYKPITIDIEDTVYSKDSDSFIGTFIAKNGSIKTNFKDEVNLENKDIKVYLGIVLANGSVEYVPQGTYRIYEVINTTEYKMMDYKIKFNKVFDTALVSYPITVDNLLKNVCSQADIELVESDYPNKDLVISNEVFFGVDASCAKVVEAIAQAACSFAKINREDKLELKWFENTNFSIGKPNLFKRNVSKNKYGIINSLVLSMMPQNSHVYIQDEASIAANGLTELKIVNNPILNVDRYVSRTEIFDRINGFDYTPFECTSKAHFHLDSGDVITVQEKDGTYTEVLVLNHKVTYKGSAKSVIESPALTKTQIEYGIASTIESKIQNVELTVNKIDAEIKAEISDIHTTINNINSPYVSPFPPDNPKDGQLWTNISESPVMDYYWSEEDSEWKLIGISQSDLDGLQGQIESLHTSLTIEQGKITNIIQENITIINGEEVTLKEAYSYMQQQIDQINFAISESGGMNKLLNSAGWNSTNFWETEGSIETLTNVDIRNNTISGYAFTLGDSHSDGKLRQSFKAIVGRKYSVSCKFKKFLNSCYVKIVNGTKDEYLFKLNSEHIEGWVTSSFFFEALSTDPIIEVYSDGEVLTISDLMVNDGEIAQQWSSNNNEIYTTNVKIDKNGLSITQDDTQNTMVIDTVQVANKHNGKDMFNLNGDWAYMQNLRIESEMELHETHFYGSPGRLRIAMVKRRN